MGYDESEQYRYSTTARVAQLNLTNVYKINVNR